MQQHTGEQGAVKPVSITQEVDDSPFMVGAEAQNDTLAAKGVYEQVTSGGGSASNWSSGDSWSSTDSDENSGGDSSKEWWEPTGKRQISANGHKGADDLQASTDDITDKLADGQPQTNGTNITPSTVSKTPASQRTDLPS